MSLQKNSSKINTTSNIEKLVPNLAILQMQYKNKMKHTITEYANNARNELNKNIRMKEHISRIKYINDLFKKLLNDIMLKKGIKTEINNLLLNFNNIFIEDNSILKNDIKEEYKKYSKYSIALKKELIPLKEQLNQLKNLNFIMENKIVCQNNIIARNKYFLYLLINNPSQIGESEYLVKNISNNFDDFLIDISKIYQETLLKALKDLNKKKSKNAEKLKKIENLKKYLKGEGKLDGCDFNFDEKEERNENDNDKEIKNENNYENSLLSFKEFELIQSIGTLENIEEKNEEDGIKIKSDIYNLPQKKLIKSSINEIVIKNKVNNINKNHNRMLSFDINKNNKKMFNSLNEFELPKLNLNQIRFNKDNKNFRLSSIDRRRISSKTLNENKNKNNSDLRRRKKKIIKNKIKQLKDKIKKNKEIIKEFKIFYNNIVNKYDNLIYQPKIESYVLSNKNDVED